MYVFVVYSGIFLHLFMSVKISMNNLNMHNGQQKAVSEAEEERH